MISKRAKLFPILFAIAIGFSFFISESIIERVSKGVYTRDRDEISAGRIDSTWLPLINEYSKDPMKLIFGNGRFAIQSSDAVARGMATDHSHPHNMYLEQVLDAGLIGLTVFISFFILLFKKLFYFFNRIENKKLNEYYYAVIISMISFFIAGLTGRTLFPSGKNCYFWIVAGIAIAIVRILQKDNDAHDQLTV